MMGKAALSYCCSVARVRRPGSGISGKECSCLETDTAGVINNQQIIFLHLLIVCAIKLEERGPRSRGCTVISPPAGTVS